MRASDLIKLKQHMDEQYRNTIPIEEFLTNVDWIDVKDRLPEVGQMALCQVNIWRYYTIIDQASDRIGEYLGGGHWYFEEADSGDAYNEVTHWQPLPKPPK